MHRPPFAGKMGSVLLGGEWQRLRRSLGLHGDMHLALGLAGEFHLAVNKGEDRVVAAETHIGARIPLGAALTDQDVAGNDGLAAELLDAEAAALGIAAVAG
jgi:hypothetical protein